MDLMRYRKAIHNQDRMMRKIEDNRPKQEKPSPVFRDLQGIFDKWKYSQGFIK